MKNALLASTLIISLFAGAGAAQAQSSRVYFAGYLGLNVYNDNKFSESTANRKGDFEFKNAGSLAGALGLRLTPQWRLEGEISRRSAELNRADVNGVGSLDAGGDITSWLYMMNIYYDIDWKWKNFQPFLTAGFGLASHEAQIDSLAGIAQTTDDTLGFAWQVGGGLKYRVSEDMALTSNYRYLGTTDLEVDSYDVEYSTHEFRLGLEYDLPTDWLR